MTDGDLDRWTVAVTGAGGYVGGVISRRMARSKLTVIRLSRRVSRIADPAACRFFDLRVIPSPETFTGVDVLVHCAWDLQATTPSAVHAINVEGTRRLVEIASSAGVQRTIFVSSLSAYDGTDQLYGRAKLECEAAVLAAGGVVVRLGLVYGPNAGGVVGSLARLVSLPIAPITASRARQFTAHEDDVAEAILQLVVSKVAPAVPLGLANPQPVTLRDVLRTTARSRGRVPAFVPVPWPIVYGLLRAGERLHLPLPFRSDALFGLVRGAKNVPNLEVVESLGLQFRPFRSHEVEP